jgi:hypothetical protein
MQRRYEQHQAEHDHCQALKYAQRAGVQQQHMLREQCKPHHGHASQEACKI